MKNQSKTQTKTQTKPNAKVIDDAGNVVGETTVGEAGTAEAPKASWWDRTKTACTPEPETKKYLATVGKEFVQVFAIFAGMGLGLVVGARVGALGADLDAPEA